MPPTLRSAGAVLAILLAASCRASTPHPATADPRPRDPATARRTCEPARVPAGIIEPTAVVDPAPLIALAKTLPPSDVLLGLVYADSAGPPRVVVVERDSIAPAVADTLRAAVQAVARRLPAAEPWGVRLRAITGLAPGLALERSQYCPPIPVEPGVRREVEVVTMTEGEVREVMATPRGPSRIRMRIDATGRVVGAVVVQSSGSQFADETSLRSVRQWRFYPALLDGVPVPGTQEATTR